MHAHTHTLGPCTHTHWGLARTHDHTHLGLTRMHTRAHAHRGLTMHSGRLEARDTGRVVGTAGKQPTARKRRPWRPNGLATAELGPGEL